MRITGIRDVKAHFRATLSLVYNYKYEAKWMKRAFGLILKNKEDVVIRKRRFFVVIALNWTPTWCLGGHRFEYCRWLRSWHADYFIIYHLSVFHWMILFRYKEYKLTTTIRVWWNVPGTNHFSSRFSGVGRKETLETNLAESMYNKLLLYRYWWNTRIFPFTKKSYLHSAQWR